LRKEAIQNTKYKLSNIWVEHICEEKREKRASMPVLDSCCCKFSNKNGSIAIGVLLLAGSLVLLGVSVGFVAGWEEFDLSFLVDASNRLRDSCAKSKMNANYTGNCTKREWAWTQVDSLHERLNNVSTVLQDIGPVWKNEFISLYNFLPWYALANVLLIVGGIKEIRGLLLIWMVATVITLIWEFTLLSILFSYDTTFGFVLTFAMLQLANFGLNGYFLLVVFSFYQELTAQRIKDIIIGRAEEYIQKSSNGETA